VKPRTLAILAAVVAALGLFVAFVDRDLPSTDERRAAEKKLFAFEADDLVRLELEWGGATVRLERDPAPTGADAPAFPSPREWRLVEPFGGRADRTLAEKLAGDLAGLEISRRLDGAARADVGLDAPRGTVRWATADAEGSIELGEAVPASSRLVAAASTSPDLVVVADTLVADLDRDPGDWRSKEVVPAARDDIERVRLVPRDGDEIVLARKGTELELERPVADRANRDRTGPLLGDLTTLRVERFLDAPVPPDAEAALAGGPGRIELSIRGRETPFVIELGREPESSDLPRVVRAGGQAFEARTRLAESLGRALEAWRSRAWTSFESWKAERLRIDDAAGTLELVRDSGDWRRDGTTISYTTVGDLLYALTSAKAERLLVGEAAAAAPLTSPRLTVVFADADGGEETLTAYDPRPDGLVPARVSGRDAVLLLGADAWIEVEAKVAAVRAADGLDAAAPKASAVDAADDGDATTD